MSHSEQTVSLVTAFLVVLIGLAALTLGPLSASDTDGGCAWVETLEAHQLSAVLDSLEIRPAGIDAVQLSEATGLSIPGDALPCLLARARQRREQPLNQS